MVNRAAIFHEPDSKYCFAVDDRRLVIRLRLAKEDKEAQVELIYGMKYEFLGRQEHQTMMLIGEDRQHAYYEVCIELSDVRVVYFFKVKTKNETLYVCESGVLEENQWDLALKYNFQMPYINAIDVHRTVSWMGKGSFYQIFIDRFARGNFEKDDHYINMAWFDSPTNKSFAGGDLAGIEEKLDYLEDLGVTALYLTPIFKSITNHKYDIMDYYAVDPQFGDLMGLKDLVDSAHQRGIKVVLDAVFNHSSNLLPEFQDVVKYGKDSKYYDWFMIEGDYPATNPLNYETFASVSHMPKWNTSNPEVKAYLLDVAAYWIRECHIDGWRLDVSDEISHDFWRAFRKVVKSENPEAVIIGENWHDAYPYLRGDQFDSVMNYGFSQAVLNYLTNGQDAKRLSEDLVHLLMRNTWQVNQMNLNLLDSHDTERFLNQIGGDKHLLMLAIALLQTFEGSPCLYYGTEITMAGGNDPDCRRGFDWTMANPDNSFWVTVRDLIRLRRSEDALHRGKTQIKTDGDLFTLVRATDKESIELYINGGSSAVPLPDGERLVSQLTTDHLIQPKGFVIVKHRK